MRLCALAWLLAYCCGIASLALGQAPSRPLTIYAATSLTDAFEALAAAFAEVEPAAEVLLNFANSSTLAAQINAGAPADIFASANEKQMALAVAGGRISEDAVRTFAHNQLTLIVSAQSDITLDSLAQLAQAPLLLVLAAPGTPIRAYTDAMLASADAEYGGRYQQRALERLVSEERNVRQVVARVALGEADAGIVYQSDVIGDVRDQLVVIAIDARHNQLASYPIAPLADAADAALAAHFIDFILSPPAQAILREYGFCSPVILDEHEPAEIRTEPTPDAATAAEIKDSPCAAPPAES